MAPKGSTLTPAQARLRQQYLTWLKWWRATVSPEDYLKFVAQKVSIYILGIRICSGPRANIIMRMRINVSPSCAYACQLTTFLIVTDTYICTYIRTYVHHENRSLIQSLALMHSAIITYLFPMPDLGNDLLYCREKRVHVYI